MSAQTIVSFRYCDTDDNETFGPVGTKLASLTQAGIPMPKGFLITNDAYIHFLKENKLDMRIKKLLTTAHFDYPETILQIQHHIENMFESAQFSPSFMNELQAFLNGIKTTRVTMSTYSLQPGNPKLGEDFADSFEAVLTNMKASWTNHFSALLLTHRNTHTIDHLSAGLIIVFQAYLPAQKTGKIFTTDPKAQTKQTLTILNHAQHGNDTYVLSKKKKTIIDRTVTPHPKHFETLTLSELHTIAKLGLAVEKQLYFPQEITWAFSNDELFLLQTKPLSLPIQLPPEKTKLHAIARGHAITKTIGTGVVHIVHNEKEFSRIQPHDVVVLKAINKHTLTYLKHIRGLIVETGELHSETNVYLRAHGTPTIYHVKDATNLLRNGTVITVNANTGEILP